MLHLVHTRVLSNCFIDHLVTSSTIPLLFEQMLEHSSLVASYNFWLNFFNPYRCQNHQSLRHYLVQKAKLNKKATGNE